MSTFIYATAKVLNTAEDYLSSELGVSIEELGGSSDQDTHGAYVLIVPDDVDTSALEAPNWLAFAQACLDIEFTPDDVGEIAIATAAINAARGQSGLEPLQVLEVPPPAANKSRGSRMELKLNTESLAGISKAGQYVLAVSVGVLAFIAVYALGTNFLNVNPSEGGSISGILGGLLVLFIWRTVRKDNEEAEESGGMVEAVTDTTTDLFNTGLAFFGVIVVGSIIGANPAVLAASGLATLFGYWAGRRVMKAIK